MERCFRSFKSEWMPETFYVSYAETEKDIMQYIKHYNGNRGHSYIDYLTPIEAEKQLAWKNLLGGTEILDHYNPIYAKMLPTDRDIIL